MNLAAKVLKTVRNYDMVKPRDNMLVAVSGGPDSVFLLRTLVSLKSKLKLGGVAVCNLDHGLRGAESVEDSAFVKDLCEKMGLRFFHRAVRAGEDLSGDLSTEEKARQLRYKFFMDAAVESGSNVIATGHTLDDQAETVIMRVVVGASLKGLAGIAPVREYKGVRIIRPLIETEKGQIVAELDRSGLSYRIDSTNPQPIYLRNVVRSQIIPFLEKYNPRLKRVLFNLAQHLREDYDFIDSARALASGRMLRSQPGSSSVAIKDIAVQPKAIQKEIMRDLLESSGGQVKRLSFRHWKEVEDLLIRKGKGNCVDLPGGIRVKKTERHLVFSRI